MATAPGLDDYDSELRGFGEIEKDIERLSSIHIIGALSLNTKSVKSHLSGNCNDWKIKVRGSHGNRPGVLFYVYIIVPN